MSEWHERKKYFTRRLFQEFEAGRVDHDLKDLLNLINSLDDYYTTSSCSGRIQIAEVRLPGEKFDIKVLGKWHWKVDPETIKNIVLGDWSYLWLMVQGPILHVVARNLECAMKLLDIARKCGFKHSGIQVTKKERILLEIVGSEEMTVPLKWKGRYLVNPEEISMLVQVSNELLEVSKQKLARFKNKIVEEFTVEA
ncbi:MAG: hypothetical protein DRJ47_04455 [Thermoprotei archaeon]|nr:MAG: hypothetical protein DRJ47_04455 [Thermoprotei archaeon]